MILLNFLGRLEYEGPGLTLFSIAASGDDGANAISTQDR